MVIYIQTYHLGHKITIKSGKMQTFEQLFRINCKKPSLLLKENNGKPFNLFAQPFGLHGQNIYHFFPRFALKASPYVAER